ncbi:TonB-dependent receptor [Candidatus Albibeggiatoa sp. nov. NOAA]|uniref:TonB-dependent receptor plug domain-containing protein n=1 Tax=Candidatus Albibeggiatoa sp. nov. NOAA TaxID=3162724 RepID=UPI0032FA1255|nr:TonB-dependent receptor [Thiotrichaceae bacterium]
MYPYQRLFVIVIMSLIYELSIAREGMIESLRQGTLVDLLAIDVITTSKTNEDLQSAPGIVTVITQQEIQAFGARSLEDVLNLVPGFTVGRSNRIGYHSTLYVRGSSSFWGESVLFLRNGQRLNEGLTGGAMSFIPDYPLDSIKQIEVIRGPSSALYGANAFMGVVNIITQTGKEYEGGQFSARAGTNEAILLKGEYGKQVSDEFNFKLYSSLNHYNDENLPQRDVTWSPDGDTQRLTNRINTDARHLFHIGGRAQFRDFDFEIGYNSSRNSNNWGVGTLADRIEDSYRHHFKTEQLNIGLKHQLDFSEHLTLQTQASYVNNRSETQLRASLGSINRLGQEASDQFATANTLLMPWNTDTLNIETTLDWHIQNHHDLILGLSYEHDRVNAMNDKSNVNIVKQVVLDNYKNSATNGMPKSQREVYALFAQYSWTINEFLKLTAGIRSDHYSDFGSTTNPRLALVYKPTNKLNIKALYGEAFRTPSLKDLYRYTRSIKPNPDLEPETIKSYELQLQYQLKHDLLLSSSFFKFNTDNVIRNVSTQNPKNPIEVQVDNLGHSNAEGVELEIFYRPYKKFSLFANYTYTNSEQEIEGRHAEIEGIPKQALNIGFQSQLTPSLDFNISAYHRWQWTSQAATPVYADFTPPDYTIINSRLIWQAQPNVKWTLDVFNALDSIPSYPSQHSFVPEGIPANGRTFLLGFEIQFD